MEQEFKMEFDGDCWFFFEDEDGGSCEYMLRYYEVIGYFARKLTDLYKMDYKEVTRMLEGEEEMLEFLVEFYKEDLFEYAYDCWLSDNSDDEDPDFEYESARDMKWECEQA